MKNLFDGFGEVEQTLQHKEEVGCHIVSMARLDRLYANWFPATLNEFQPMIGVVCHGDVD